MDIVSLMLEPLQWPASGVWESIIKWFSGVGNFAWAIVLLTICLKVVLLPLDFWQRAVSRKMSAQQGLMKPELDEIKKKYGDRPDIVNQKSAELYKKYNVNPMSSCLGMLVYMLVTCVVFFTLFSALGTISRTQINYEYYQLRQEYAQVYEMEMQTTEDTSMYESKEEYAKAIAQKKVAEKYDDIKQGFLSVKNIWRPDNWSTVFPSADEFISSTNTKFVVVDNAESELNGYVVLSNDSTVKYTDLSGKTYNISEYENNESAIEAAKTQFKEDFNVVTSGINVEYKGQWNGFLILVILSGAITFLSQYLSTLGIKTKDKNGKVVRGAKPNPIAGLFISVIMIFFTISYTSAFAVYIVTNSLVSMLFTYLVNLILNGIENKKNKKKEILVKPDYVR